MLPYELRVEIPRNKDRGPSFVKSDSLNSIISLLPIVLITGFLYFLLTWAVVFSFCDSVGLAPRWNFVGLRNYLNLFSRARFWIALTNNLLWLGILIVSAAGLGLVLAYLISFSGRLESLFRVLFLYPIALSFVVTGTIWNWMYVPDTGVVNTVLRSLHLNFLTSAWLADPEIALYALIATSIWQFTGFGMIVYLAAIKEVPSAIIESAQIDGASAIQIFLQIIIPSVHHATLVVTAMLGIFSLKMLFPLVWVTTRGAPIDRTEVLSHLMYVTTFSRIEMTIGAAISVIMFILASAIILPYAYWYMNRWFQ